MNGGRKHYGMRNGGRHKIWLTRTARKQTKDNKGYIELLGIWENRVKAKTKLIINYTESKLN